MPITLTCDCGRKLQVKDEMAGKKGKCPACGKILLIPAQSEPPSQVPAEPQPADQTAQETRPCPHCTKPIPLDAVFCTACGTDLRTGEKHQVKDHPAEQAHAGYDPFKLILPAVSKPIDAVGIIVDSPLTAQSFYRVLAVFGIGALCFALLWTANAAKGASTGYVTDITRGQWAWWLPTFIIAACFAVVIDAVFANITAKFFSHTGTTLAHTVIAILLLDGVWMVSYGAFFIIFWGSHSTIISGWFPWILLSWNAYLCWVLLYRAYDAAMPIAISFAIAAAGSKAIVVVALTGLITWISTRIAK